MAFWTEVHWSEGMFLRPHHLQTGQRWMETVVRAGLDASRPFPWGFLSLEVAKEPLENSTLRLDRCQLRLKDGTWVSIPENTEVEPLDFKKALESAGGSVDICLGVPQMQEVRANSVPLENPEQIEGSPRYEPRPVARRDENTGANPQTVYVRRMRGRLFVEGEDTTGYEIVRLGRIKRSDRPGAVPELDELAPGPLLAIQAHPGLSAVVTSLTDQVESKNERLVETARDHQMDFTHDLSSAAHLLRLHAVNEALAHLKAVRQCPTLHPYDVFVVLSRLIGLLSVFHVDLAPRGLPNYDHDQPGDSFARLRSQLETLLDAVLPARYEVCPFGRKKDEHGREGLEVEVKRQWIDDNLDMYVALYTEDMDISELERYVYGTLDLKLASPKRATRIHNIAVRGLRLQIKAVPPTTLPRRPGLHYFRVDKTIGSDRTDYWKECEQERGIRMSIREGQLAAMERFKPELYVALKVSK